MWPAGAGEREAPPAVIRALATAAARQGPDCSRLLEDVLRRALSRRWLSEHGIGDKITSAEAGAGARLPGHRRPPAATETGPRWQLFATDPEGRVSASPLPWLCLLQVVLIVLVVLRL